MEDSYIDEFSKLALALTSGQLAKRAYVSDTSIGQDLNFNFIGWKDNKVALIVQLDRKHMLLPIEERLGKCTGMCMALRNYWGVDGISMIAEGWCSRDPEKTKGLDLGKEFLNKNSGVEECLSIVHAQINDDDEISVSVMASPYAYTGENAIEFGELIFYSDGGIHAIRDKKFPAMLYKSLMEEKVEGLPRQALEEIIIKMNLTGFHTQEFI